MHSGSAAHLADTYARSLLDLAKESRTVDPIAADLETISVLLTQEPDLQEFLASPYFAEQIKRDLVRKVLTGKLHRITVNFLSVVIDHNRGALLPEIIDRYRQLHREYQGYETVSVTVAQRLSPEQTEKLARDLAQALQTKIDLDIQVDPSLLGGVILRHGDKMLDNSVRGRLQRTVGRIANPQNRYRRMAGEG